MTSNLTAEHWLQAAFRALSTGGPQAIRAEAIARDLKVSKGSFYWHFKDVPALKHAMLDHWKQNATSAIIVEVTAAKGSAADKLRALISIAVGQRNQPYGGLTVEAAIRDWSRFDAHVAKTVRDVEEQRVAFVTELFATHGATSPRADAEALYGGLIGLETLAALEAADLSGSVMHLLEALLVKQ